MSDFSQNQSSPIAMYVDDVYKGVGALQALQLFDVERIEVLRGPQGTLYGKNATGGSVNIISKIPSLDGTNQANFGIGFGNFNRREANGVLELSNANSTMGVRLAGTFSKADGWVDNLLESREDLSEFRDYAFRLSGRYQPSDELNILIKLAKSRAKQNNGHEVLASNIGDGGVGFDSGYNRNNLEYFENETDRQGRNNLENSSVSVSVDWDVNDVFTLTSVSAYDEGEWITEEDADGSPLNILHTDYGSDVTSISQDLRLTSNFDGLFNFLLGLYGHREDLNANVVQRMYYDVAGDNDGSGTLDCFEDFMTGCRLSNEFNQVKSSQAAYFQGGFKITSDLTLTLGMRYTKDENRIEDYNARLGYFDPDSNTEVIEALPTIVDYKNGITDYNFGKRLALKYALSSDINTYISFTTGYRGSAFNGQAYFDVSEISIAKPEEVDAWEVGFKSDLLDDRLRLNGAVFHYTYINQQFLDITPNFLSVLVNADKSSVQGAELELRALPHSDVDLRVGLGYLDATYDKLELRGVNLSGNKLINAPSLNVNALVNWDFLEVDSGYMHVTLDTNYTGGQYYDAFNNTNTHQEGYWIWNMRFSYKSHDDKIIMGLWVKNLFDEEYVTQMTDLQELFNYDYSHRGRTRTFGFDINYQF